MKSKLIILFVLLTVVSCGQIKRFRINPAYQINDTTTNFYVYSDLHLDQVLADSVNAPSDSIFIMQNVLLDSVHVISVTCYIGSYDYDNRAIIFGADTLTGFTEVTGTSGDAIIDTVYPAANTDDVWRSGSSGYTYNSNYFDIGGQFSTGDRSAVRFVNVTERAVFDSALVEFTSYTTNNTGEVILRFYGENSSNPATFPTAYTDFDTRYANKTTAYKDTTFSNQWNDGTNYKFRVTEPIAELLSANTYSGSQALALFIATNGGTSGQYRQSSAFDFSEKPKLILYSHGEATPGYEKKYVVDSVYQVYFGSTYGTHVENKNSVNGAGNWYYTLDTLYVYSSASGVIATTRNGFNVTGNATIAGFDIQKCNNGIKTSGTVDTLTIRQNRFTHNVYGLIDSADGTSLVDHNIIAHNENNFYAKNKDTLYFYNNTLFSYSNPLATTNFVADESKLSISNNMFWVNNSDNGLEVGDIDTSSNILVQDYNGYGCSFYGTVADKFWTVGVTKYDSLNQYQGATTFEDNSFEIRQFYSSPYNTIYNVWQDFGYQDELNFIPRYDSIIISPLINSGAILGTLEDFNGDDFDAIPAIGAVERVTIVEPPTLASATMVGDSALLTLDYDTTVWDSMSVYANDQFIETIVIAETHYVNPTRSTSFDNPEVYSVNAVVSDTAVSTTTIVFYVSPNNDSTTYRIRYGIGSLTDSTSGAIAFIFIPEATTYKVLFEDVTYGERWSSEVTLTYTDSMSVEVLLSGLANDTTYTADVTALNDSGWLNTDNITFRIPSPLVTIADYYVSPDSTYKTIAQVNALSLDSGDVVAFEGGQRFADAVLFAQRGATYKSFGTGLAIIGDSTVNISLNPQSTTVLVEQPHVVLDSLKIYGYLDAYRAIVFNKDSLTVSYCELAGGGNAHNKSSGGIVQTSTSVDGLNVQHNNIHNWGEAAIKWTRPVNSDISYNEIYWLWRTTGSYDYGASGIMNGAATSLTNSNAFHDCNYTVNIHHNEFSYIDHVAVATLSRIIIERNIFSNPLPQTVYHNGIKYRFLGKLYDVIGDVGESKGGVIFRYNYVANGQFRGEDNWTYKYPTDVQRTAGTTDSIPNVLGKPQYLTSTGSDERPTGIPEASITGAGTANVYFHNNIFYNLGGAVANFIQNDANDGSFTTLPITYFVNNTILKVGSNNFASNGNDYFGGVITLGNYKPSPTHVVNNIIHDESRNGGAVSVQTNGDCYLGYNLFLSERSDSTLTLPVDNTKKAYNIFGRALSSGTPEGTFIGNIYDADSSLVWNNMASTVFCDSIGIAGAYIPDVRLVISGSANNAGKSYSTIGDTNTVTYLEWEQTHSMGVDPTGRSFAYDIFGKLRTDNDIGAVGDTALNP